MSYLWKGEVVELPPDTEVGVTQAQARGTLAVVPSMPSICHEAELNRDGVTMGDIVLYGSIVILGYLKDTKP